jgi:hypothetical protein
MLDIKHILIWLMDLLSSFAKTLIISVMLIYFLADIFVNGYIDISSQICTEYSGITNKKVKYFDVVGCFEKIDNNWVKVN